MLEPKLTLLATSLLLTAGSGVAVAQNSSSLASANFSLSTPTSILLSVSTDADPQTPYPNNSTIAATVQLNPGVTYHANWNARAISTINARRAQEGARSILDVSLVCSATTSQTVFNGNVGANTSAGVCGPNDGQSSPFSSSGVYFAEAATGCAGRSAEGDCQATTSTTGNSIHVKIDASSACHDGGSPWPTNASGDGQCNLTFTVPQACTLTIVGSASTAPIGASQSDPILPCAESGGTFAFCQVPTNQWFDPPLALGYRFQQNGPSLFTDILALPTGVDGDGFFDINVGQQPIGRFPQGARVDFVQLIGHGVPEFSILGIDPAKDATDTSAFPVQLTFNTVTADFTMTPLQWRAHGSSCVDASSCPACALITIEPNSSALLGNQTFGLRAHNTPTGSFSIFAASVGQPIFQPFACGTIGLSAPIIDAGSAFSTGSNTCDGASATAMPIPNDPYLFGFFITAQAGFLCPAGGIGLSNVIEFVIGS